MKLVSLTKAIVVRVRGRDVGRVDITNCGWCTDLAVCSACSARADEVRIAHGAKPHSPRARTQDGMVRS